MLQEQRQYWAAFFLFFLLLGSSGYCMAADPVLRNGIYIIQMAESDMTAAATRDGGKSPMILWPYRPTATWEFRHLKDNVYTVRTNNTLLDAQGEGSGSAVSITHPHKGASQQWKLKRVGQFYQFINVQTGQAMTLSNGKRVKGSRLEGSSPTDSLDQLFCIQRPNAPRFCGNESNTGDDKSYKKGKTPRRDQQDEIEDNTNFYINKTYPK